MPGLRRAGLLWTLAGLLACDGMGPTGARAPADPQASGSELTSLEPGRATRIYYQFTDEAGQVRFVESLEAVPAAWRDRVGYVEMSGPPPTSPMDMKRAMAPDYQRLAAASPKAAAKIILYGADWCGACRQAKAWLRENGHAFEERDVDQPGPKQELREKTGGGSIPVIEVGGRILKGFNPQALEKMIDQVG